MNILLGTHLVTEFVNKIERAQVPWTDETMPAAL